MNVAGKTVIMRGKPPARWVDGEGVVVSTEKGEANVLNETGFALWQWIDNHRTVADLTALLADQYDLEVEQAERDTAEFITDLVRRELIELK